MWVFFNGRKPRHDPRTNSYVPGVEGGFVSAVMYRDRPEWLMVRGRDEQSLKSMLVYVQEALPAGEVPDADEPYKDMPSDYPWRVVIARDHYQLFLESVSNELSYTNVKSSFYRHDLRESSTWHQVMMKVWGALHGVTDPSDVRENDGRWLAYTKSYLPAGKTKAGGAKPTAGSLAGVGAMTWAYDDAIFQDPLDHEYDAALAYDAASSRDWFDPNHDTRRTLDLNDDPDPALVLEEELGSEAAAELAAFEEAYRDFAPEDEPASSGGRARRQRGKRGRKARH